MTYNYQQYSFTAFTEADLLQGVNGSSIGCGDTFVMPASASVCISTWDNDSTLSGDSWCDENANDSTGQHATIDGARVGSQMYAESYHVLRGSDGKTYYLIEIEVEGYNAPGAGDDYFTFYGAVPPAGVSLTVVNTCNVTGEWVSFNCLGAGAKAPANTAPTFTNVPSDGIICVDENTTFVIDLAASDADGDSLTYKIVGGRDASFFDIDPHTGELTFIGAPDYENPLSGGGNNTYDVTVEVSDGNGGTETKAMWIKVKDVAETGWIKGRFTNDADCNDNEWNDQTGTWDTGVAGATIELLDLNGNVVATSVTDSYGNYMFDVPAGDYQVRFPSQSGKKFSAQDSGVADHYDSDADANGLTDVISLSAGQVVANIDAGIKDAPGGGTCIVIEAEDMTLCGYTVEHNSAASGGDVVKGSIGCWGYAKTTFQGTTDSYDLKLSVIDENDGQGWIYIYVNGQDVSGPIRLNQDTGGDGVNNSTFRVIELQDIQLNAGDEIKIWGYGQGCEFVRLDKLEICSDGDPMTAELGDRVWFDADKDGIQDAGEAGIAGVTVLLKDAAGNTLATTTTDANGDYLFSGLAAGDYKVCVVPANGLAFTGQDAGNDAADSDVDATGMTGVITLAEGESNLTVDAGLVDPGTASISGTYFCDENDNDVQDTGEAVLAGQTVWLLKTGSGIIASTTTDANGNYSFTGLDAGNYCVRFDGNNNGGKTFVAGDVGGDDAVDSDVVNVGSAGNGNTAKFDLGIGETKTNVDAGVEDPGTASLAGRVFCDDNDNDVDDGEQGVGGVSVTLLTAAGAVVATTTTAADGSYSFSGLDAGDYKVMFDESTAGGKTLVNQNVGTDDTVDSDADASGMTGVYTLNIGDNVTDVDAGVETVPGSLSGRYFCDENNNGVDDGEVGVGGVTVQLLDGNGNPTGASTTTAADGSYSFGNLAPGTYGVKFTDTVSGKTLITANVGTDDGVDSDATDLGNGMSQITGIVVQSGQDTPDNDAGVETVVTNTDPVVLDDMAKFCADMTKDIDILFNDTDADGDILSVTSISDADETVGVGGTLTLASGATVTLNMDGTVTHDGVAVHAGLLVGQEFNEETISYTVSDGNGGTGTGNLDITVCGAKATLQMICDILPSQVQLSVSLTGNPLDFQITVVDDPNSTLDDNLASAIWSGACIDINGTLVLDQVITANIYGPCDTLPAGLIANAQNLDNIGWLINQQVVGTGTYDIFDVQEAVWVLSDGTSTSNADANALVQMALSQGEGWVAQEGDLVPIVFDPVGPITDAGGNVVTNTQTFIMGVDWETLDPDCLC